MPTSNDTSAARGQNGVVVTSPDPTTNVRELVDAEIRRVDDLRKAESRRIDESIAAERRRVAELSAAESRRIDESNDALRREAALRADFARDFNIIETKRIDAIRTVDVGAVAIANEKATGQAGVLAGQVSASAEALRALVASQAAALATQFATATSQLSERISSLERSSYEGQGRSKVADPALEKMVAALELMQANQSKGEGRSGISSQLLIAIAVAFGGLAVFLIEQVVR